MLFRSTGHLNSYSLELQHRLDGLQALYEANTTAPLPNLGFMSVAMEFIGRGGQLHYVIDAEDRVLGSAYVLGAKSLLENLNPVERLFVSLDIDAEARLAVAKSLLASIVETAKAAVSNRPDCIWIQVFIPDGAHEHPESQPILAALEVSGFRGAAMPRAQLWTRLIENANPD